MDKASMGAARVACGIGNKQGQAAQVEAVGELIAPALSPRGFEWNQRRAGGCGVDGVENSRLLPYINNIMRSYLGGNTPKQFFALC
jgi:hypothetical protein